MTLVERKQILKVALRAAGSGGRVALRYFRRLKNVSLKKGAGLVSEADRESEEIIRKMILTRFPHHRFLGEEGGMSKGKSRALWHVDPLDGTTNYVHGFPFFCVSIALEYDGELQVAVVHAPLLNQTFTALKGGGAYLNGCKINVSQTSHVRESLLATGFSYSSGKHLDREIADFKKFSRKARGIRRAGSAALDMCMVASGVFDGFWERALASWDTAAGTLLVREAGGKVTNFKGEPYRLGEGTIVASNTALHSRILATLKP